ncbi:MAG: hypothetical protein PHO41_09625 [Eubacteriales bacterium]|nr:hypothetical protein [Eubacteriales bacterium]
MSTAGAKRIAQLAAASALLIIVQMAFAFLPNIELVSLLVMLYTVVWGRQAYVPVLVFVLVEGLIYGFGLWFCNYLYVWPILVIASRRMHKNAGRLSWALLSCVFGLLFGALCAIPYLFIGGAASAFAYWVAGIPFDLIHGVSNFIVALLLFQPLKTLLERLTAANAR